MRDYIYRIRSFIIMCSFGIKKPSFMSTNKSDFEMTFRTDIRIYGRVSIQYCVFIWKRKEPEGERSVNWLDNVLVIRHFKNFPFFHINGIVLHTRSTCLWVLWCISLRWMVDYSVFLFIRFNLDFGYYTDMHECIRMLLKLFKNMNFIIK